jgi:hypothetical protein
MVTQTALTGSPVPIAIAPGGYSLEAPDLVGTVTELGPRTSATRSDGGVLEDRLQEALQDAGITNVKVFEVEVTADRSPPGSAAAAPSGLSATTRQGEPAIVLRVPDLGPDLEYAVLYTDEAGVSRWVWPAVRPTPAGPATRGGEGEIVFLLPRASASLPPPEQAPATRGPISKLGRRLVRVLVWATDSLVGFGARAVAERWEGKNRPYALRPFLAEEGAAVSWESFRNGPALLLLHGTFSTARSAFAELPAATREALASRYGGRVLAFDHPTLHHSPHENVRELFARLPEGTPLEVDIVSHSRGGLVGRELIERQADFAAAGRTLRVRKAIFVAVPNLGTILTDGDHGLDLLDRYTNLLTDLPDDAFTLTLEGVLALAKILAHGALVGLPGLNCMFPGGDYLGRLNASPRHHTEYFAAAANFVPTAPGLLARLGSFVAGRFIASVFGEDNDGVVPTRGCYESALGAPAFPIPRKSRLLFGPDDGVHHCNFFGNERLNERLLEWLTG